MESLDALVAAAQHAWDRAWQRLFDARTNLFYDYVSSYDPARRFDHLPTPAEIARQYPNPNGWASGMEDSMINGGVMLAAACDRFAVTGEDHLRESAATIFDGLYRCATLSPAEGLVLRSISPWDGRSYFTETSRDQLTHLAHGLWRYAHSPLCGKEQRSRIRDAMVRLCRRLEARVTAANDYHFGREDGTPGLVDKMWEVEPHEAARLPMIYAVGWDVTGDAHWRDLYQHYLEQALKCAQRIDFSAYSSAYPLFQHQISMEVLGGIADRADPLRPRWREQMGLIADRVVPFFRHFGEYRPLDVRTLNMDFRTWANGAAFRDGGRYAGYGHVPDRPEPLVRREVRPLRDVGEALLVRLMAPDAGLTSEQSELLSRSLTEVDYSVTIQYAMLMPQAAFWRYAANLTRCA